MKLIIGSDHAGYELKEKIKSYLQTQGEHIEDFGTTTAEACDYPDVGVKVADYVANHADSLGILICGTGVGIGIAANRHRWIRSGVCHDATTARLTRQHNNANVLALGARVLGPEVARECLRKPAVRASIPDRRGAGDRRRGAAEYASNGGTLACRPEIW